jgi:hypothetical protein
VTVGESWAAQGFEVSIDPIENSPKSLVTATLAGTEDGDPDADVQSIWTLNANTVDRSLWEHPKVTVWTRAMSTEGLAQFRADVNAILAGEVPIDITGLPADLQTFIKLIGEGTDSYQKTEWVLRNTRIVSPFTSLRPNQENTMKVFTTAELDLVEDVPDTILFQLPAGDWLKLTGTTEQMQDGRFQFSQEWWWRESTGWDQRLIYEHADLTVARKSIEFQPNNGWTDSVHPNPGHIQVTPGRYPPPGRLAHP